MTIRWPITLLRARDVAFDIAPRTLAGPSSVSGFTQVSASDAGIWKATLAGVYIHNRDTRLAWRTIDILLEGRLNPILIPLCRADQPVPAEAITLGLYESTPHSDLAYFDDDSGYVIDLVIDVVAAANAAVRATSMQVTVNYASNFEAGQHFSVGERLYRVRGYDSTTGTMTFRPPLREAVTAGDRLAFDNPVGRFRLASDQEMNLELFMRKSAAPTVQFIEDL